MKTAPSNLNGCVEMVATVSWMGFAKNEVLSTPAVCPWRHSGGIRGLITQLLALYPLHRPRAESNEPDDPGTQESNCDEANYDVPS